MRVKEFFCLIVGRQAPESGSKPSSELFQTVPLGPSHALQGQQPACELGIWAGLAPKPLTSRLCSLTITVSPPKAIMKTK